MASSEQNAVLPNKSRAYTVAEWAVIAVFSLAGLAGVSLAFQLLAPTHYDTGIDHVSQKLTTVAEATRDADIVFIGTSVVYRNVDTKALNEESARRNCGLKFHNLGLPAMTAAEFQLLLEEIGKTKPQRSRPLQVYYHPILYYGMTNIRSRRTKYANRLGTLDISWKSVWAEGTAARIVSNMDHESNSWPALMAFARSWVMSVFRKGDLGRIIFDRPTKFSSLIAEYLKSHDGFMPLVDDPDEAVAKFGRRTEFRQKNVQKFKQETSDAVARIRQRNGVKSLTEDDLTYHRALIGAVQKNADRVSVFFPPLVTVNPTLVDFYRQSLGENEILDINFMEYPEFGDPSLWYDGAHLDKPGIAKLTGRLIEHFCRK